MKSRWFQVPTLHVPVAPKSVSWLELFYDLIFVAAFIQLGNGLSNQVSLGGFLGFCILFVPLWLGWTGFSFFCNRFNIDDFTHRLMVFAQMFAVGAMAITAPMALQGKHIPFILCVAVSQLVIAALFFRAWWQVVESRSYSRYWGTIFLVGALLWAGAALLPAPLSYWMCGLGLAEIILAPFRKHSRKLAEEYPTDREHLSERFGLLTMIVLGESFVKVLTELSGVSSVAAVVQAIFILMITCCIWWVYFDDVAECEIKDDRISPIIWLYAHLPLQIGITASGVAIKKAVLFELENPAPSAYRWLLCGTIAMIFISTSLLDAVTERREAELSDRLRVNVKFAAGLLLLAIPAATNALSALWFLIITVAICVAQVLIDMVVAPLKDDYQEHASIADLVRAHQSAKAPETSNRKDVSTAVRKGTPADYRRDLYFFLIEGSWKVFFVVASFLFLFINIIFASLYLLQPGAIAGIDTPTFADAFFFSVQTISTIGYGALSPASDYGNMIVTIEAAVGILYVALATGITFAKASRPKQTILFTNSMVVSPYNGVPTLQLRVGNARGNDIIDASVAVVALFDEVSSEGQHLRRLVDLPLARDNTPMFSLSWSIFHTIDESSPLHGIDFSNLESSKLVNFIVTLTGHDGTYGQTIYARQLYYHEHLQHNRVFEDVVGHLPDGRFIVDYHKFHETKPLAELSEAV